MKLGKVFTAIALVLCISGSLWIMINPRYTMTLIVSDYDTPSNTQPLPLTIEATASAYLDMPYAVMLIIIGLIFAILAIFVDERRIKVE